MMATDTPPQLGQPRPGERADLIRRLRVWKLLVDAEQTRTDEGLAPANSLDQLQNDAVALLMAVSTTYWPRTFDDVDDALNFLLHLDA